MSSYSITKRRNNLRIKLQNALDSDYKAIGMTDDQGEGKTTIAEDEMLSREKNSFMLVNNQRLSFEIFNTAMKLALNRGSLPYTDNYIDILHGKGYILSENEQLTLGKPECLCNLYKENNNIFNIRDKGYLPNGYCKIFNYADDNSENKKYNCPFAYECEHKDQIARFFRLKKLDMNKIILAPKAYVHTNIVDSYVDTFDNPNLIIDENSDSLYYDQLFLSSKIINNFKNFIDEILQGSKGLRYLWTAFKKVLMKIQNAIEYETGINSIHKSMITFIDSYSLKDLIEWNELIKSIIMHKSKHSYDYKIGSAKNIIPKFITIFENDNNKYKFKGNMFVDFINKNFTYYINKIDHMRELANNVRRTIFTDANLTLTNLKKIYPDLADNIKIINNSKNLKSKFRNVWVLGLNNKKRGAYGITTLINSRTKQYHDSFNNIAKILKDIIIYQAGEDRRIGLIISMQKVSKDLQKKMSPVIAQTDSNVNFEYYYNIEGINKYKNVYWIVLFGSCNIPQEARKIISRFTDISEIQLLKLYGSKQMLQAAHRGRPNLRPNQIDLYSLSNTIAGHFKKEQNFKGIVNVKYKKLLEFINESGGHFVQDIQKFLGCKSINTAVKICNNLYFNGSLGNYQKVNKKTNKKGTFWYTKNT